MIDELDSRLNASAPRVSGSDSVDAELTALAYSAQRLARVRRGLRWRRIGIPILVGAMALGGTGAALTSPAVQRSLGITHAPPKAVKPFPKVSLTLPISGCTLIVQLNPNSSKRITVRGIESIQAATAYLSHVDVAAIEQSDIFRSTYQPVAFEPAPTDTPDEIASEREINQELNRTSEQQAVWQALWPGMVDAADKHGQDPSVLWGGGSTKCPGDHK